MIEFKHSDVSSIRCPLHNQRESFTAGSVIQPADPLLVRYPCGYVDGLPEKLGFEPAVPVFDPGEASGKSFEILRELSNRVKRLEERGAPRRSPSTPAPQTPGKRGGVAL